MGLKETNEELNRDLRRFIGIESEDPSLSDVFNLPQGITVREMIDSLIEAYAVISASIDIIEQNGIENKMRLGIQGLQHLMERLEKYQPQTTVK